MINVSSISKINNFFITPLGDFERDNFDQKEEELLDLAIRPENINIKFQDHT